MRNGRYLYSFSPWPDETWKFDPAVYRLFEYVGNRVEMEFNAEDFERFRSALSHHGFTLREIERVPYVAPEPVS